MSDTWQLPDGLEAAVLEAVHSRSGRVLIGISGVPGVGKSTAARLLQQRLAEQSIGAVVVPMDGFHLAQSALAELGRADRKGAPDTFDADGYVALLRRLRTSIRDVWAPAFDRDLEEAIAGSIRVGAEIDVVITEGNYLLLPDAPWSEVTTLLDLTVHLTEDEEVRRRRLHARHVAHGRTPEQASAWMEQVDDPNAALVSAVIGRADLVLALSPGT